MENTVHVAQMLPNESADVGVVGDRFVTAVFGFISCRGPLNAAVVDKRPGDVRDLVFEDERVTTFPLSLLRLDTGPTPVPRSTSEDPYL